MVIVIGSCCVDLCGWKEVSFCVTGSRRVLLEYTGDIWIVRRYGWLGSVLPVV